MFGHLSPSEIAVDGALRLSHEFLHELSGRQTMRNEVEPHQLCQVFGKPRLPGSRRPVEEDSVRVLKLGGLLCIGNLSEVFEVSLQLRE